MSQDELTVFNIQKYSLHDGTGIRTVVFLKGCPLRCLWCANPESQNPAPELMYRRSRCIGCDKCGLCLDCAPKGSVSRGDDGMACIDHRLIGSDLDWVKVCPAGALSIEGRIMDIQAIIREVEKDEVFYRHGGGGLTISGGEPLIQDGAVLLLKYAKERHINTSAETCGYVDTDRLLEAAGYLDQIFYDIKCIDEEKHLKYTGVSNHRILDNLRILRSTYADKRIRVRTPVIPGFNDCEDELDAIEGFIRSMPDIEWEKLKYHTYGVGKYEMLGRKYLMQDQDII